MMNHNLLAFYELKDWIDEHMPELASQLRPMRLVDTLPVLAEVTGVHVSPDETIHEGSLKFLEALKAKHVATVSSPSNTH